jgi:hypothetical protein
MNTDRRIPVVLSTLTVVFLGLAVAFIFDLWGTPRRLQPIPLVDKSFLDSATVRQSYAELKRTGADLSDFDCYGCHEKAKPPPLRYDENHNLIIPKEHENIVMGHGRHNRNNNCYNCHDEHNLERFQIRDGRELTFANSTPLCGSCHGPTYRDWEAGAHGRKSGGWARNIQAQRQDCVACHNPHSPKIPPRKPAPAPNPLWPMVRNQTTQDGQH